MLPALLQKLGIKQGGKKPFELATEKDLYYCYRLLLRREPDREGWEFWTRLIADHGLTLDALVDSFLHGDEFRAQQEANARPRLVELDEFKIFVHLGDFFIGRVIANGHIYEAHVTRQVRDLLKPGDTFLDIGANIGYFTLLAAALVGPQGKVIAFEPRADNCKLLQDSIAENGFRNIDLHPYAVAEREQTFVIDASGANTNGRIVDYSPASTAIEVPPHLVKAVTLDGFLAEVADIDLIKMDIEGAEPRAWQGMQGVVQRYRPAIITEFSPSLIQLTSHATAESFLDLIHAQGYEIFILHRTRAKDSVPAGKETILQTLADSGLTHLDLLALPAAG